MKKSIIIIVNCFLNVLEIYGILYYTQYYLLYNMIHVKYVNEYPVLMLIALLSIIVGIVRIILGKITPLACFIMLLTMTVFFSMIFISDTEYKLKMKLFKIVKNN